MGTYVSNYTESRMLTSEVFQRIQNEIIHRYQVDARLASEMTCDFLEVLTAIDGDIEIFEKYFLH